MGKRTGRACLGLRWWQLNPRVASRHSFRPEWASAPGETILDILQERDISHSSLACSLGESIEQLDDLLEGHRSITLGLAKRLNETLGGSVEFWMQRDHQYRTDSERLTEEAWLRELPVKDMIDYGWIPGPDETDPLSASLEFFGVDKVIEWSHSNNHLVDRAALRASDSYPSEAAALSAWLRRGELQAKNLDVGRWDANDIEQALIAARSLTRIRDPEQFLLALRERFGPCGLAVVAERLPAKCSASGAAWFRSEEQAVVLLSFRYLSDDHFWFTFFHEVAHLLLHGGRQVYVDSPEDELSEREEEANKFAATALIPAALRSELDELPLSKRAIIRFARRAGISPGIVVGQLQHAGKLSMDGLNDLKRRYHWSESSFIRPGQA